MLTMAGERDLTYLWVLVALELGLAVLSDLINRGITLMDSLLGDLFSNQMSVRLMEHAAELDLQHFEDPDIDERKRLVHRAQFPSSQSEAVLRFSTLAGTSTSSFTLEHSV